jgi:dTMP kinase
LFITFEGIEGCGKTTQVERLAARLDRQGIKYIKTLEPGGTEIGNSIRKILLDSGNTNLFSLTELVLYIADRAQHMAEVIKPALVQNRWVICDRFFDATVAYQGFGRGQDMDLINRLNDIVTQGVKPDITILMDCPEDIGLSRALERNRDLSQEDQGRFEKEKIDFHRKVRQGYLKLAEMNRDRFIIVDASQSVDQVEKDIMKIVSPHMTV